MFFSRSFVVFALLGLGAATTHAGEASKTAVPASEKSGSAMAAAASGSAAAGMVATHVIQVGGANGSLTFSPDNVKAAVGDLVQFQFNPKNHSVVQSSFDQPCVPIQNVMKNMTTAFFSGYMPTNASAAAKQTLTYTIRVMDAKPVWFYCSQAKHCQGGMVGAINAAETGNKTMSAFKSLAAKAIENITPGSAQAVGSGGGSGAASPSASSGSSSGSGTGTGAGTGTNAGTASSGAAAAGGAAASSTSSANSPAQQTTNAAPGLKDAAKQSLFGLSIGALAAFMVL
ncbi:hypothetical protein P280DRAFT_489265 [Massarina eburnea CBS 473.64]|uniref:Cupredoxin n=1 Tax=Massarina eburnea CBS 473.64 TaxID=1395130 RepID=A0A6A6S595_9PLEO|nr:hypothetical protein P280DRAFT_489265 [Massarina eburnea CBS 473.64]